MTDVITKEDTEEFIEEFHKLVTTSSSKETWIQIITDDETGLMAEDGVRSPQQLEYIEITEITSRKPKCDCGGEKCKLPCVGWCSTRIIK